MAGAPEGNSDSPAETTASAPGASTVVSEGPAMTAIRSIRRDQITLTPQDALVAVPTRFIEHLPEVTTLAAPTVDASTVNIEEIKFSTPAVTESACSICMERFEQAAEIPVVLKCGHVFGHKCISSWLQQRQGGRSCTECRADPYIRPLSGTSNTADGPEVPGVQGTSDTDIVRQLDVPDEGTPPRGMRLHLTWTRSEIPGLFLMNIGGVYQSTDIQKIPEILLLIAMCRTPARDLIVKLERNYISHLTHLWDTLEAAMRQTMSRDTRPPEETPFRDLLRELAICRTRSQCRALLSINQTTTIMMRAAIMQTQYLSAATFAERLRLGEWLTQPMTPFTFTNYGFEYQAFALLVGMRDRLDGLYGGSVWRGLRGLYPFHREFLGAVGPAALRVEDSGVGGLLGR